MTSSRQVFTIDNLDNKSSTTDLTGIVTASILQSGTTFLISIDDTTTLNLPAAEVGLNYSVYIQTDLTNALTIAPDGSDTWRANLRYIDKDTDGASSFNGGSTTEGFIHYVGSADYTANADTKGTSWINYLK